MKMLKKLSHVLLLVLCASILSGPVAAADATGDKPAQEYTLIVNGETLDLSELPRGVYYENGYAMIPLRKTAEALGNPVTWLPDEQWGGNNLAAPIHHKLRMEIS